MLLCFQGVQQLYPTPSPQSIDCNAHLPWVNMKFGSVDIRICQPKKTLAYARALQHWVELTNSPMPGQPHPLVEYMIELRESMAPFTTFMDAEVFSEVEGPCWVWVTPSKALELEEPEATLERSCSQNRIGHSQGSFSLACSRKCTKSPIIPLMANTISSQH